MIISYLGEEKFKIKTKDAEILLNDGKVEIDGFVIDRPGEYERKNIFVESLIDKPVYKLFVEEVKMLYMGKVKSLTDREVEEIDGIDLIFLPGGSEDSMGLKNALDLAATLEPGIIIPMLYESMESLQKEGIEGEVVKTAKISKSSIPEEGRIVIIPEKSN
jgi:hypothetical protein